MLRGGDRWTRDCLVSPVKIVDCRLSKHQNSRKNIRSSDNQAQADGRSGAAGCNAVAAGCNAVDEMNHRNGLCCPSRQGKGGSMYLAIDLR